MDNKAGTFAPHTGSSLYMVDENPLDGVEDIPE